MSTRDRAREKTGKDQIEKLADHVDEKFKNTPQFMGWKPFLIKNWFALFSVGFFLTMLVVLLLFISEISKDINLSLNQLPTGTTLALYLALGASLIAVMNLFVGVLNFIKPAAINEDVISYNYKKLEMSVQDDEELPFLKALIILKSRNPEFCLRAMLRSYDEEFCREMLFKILYFVNIDSVGQAREVESR
jgi:hypothetical protein